METAQLITRLRRLGLEPTDVEVKAAGGGLPSSVPETISAFANGSGGTLLLGIDEEAGFRSVQGFQPSRIRDALADACANKVEPPCRAPIQVEEFEGAVLLRLDISELDPVEKPCFVQSRGHYGGSFIRGGDGDRRLNHYEVSQLLTNRSQPAHDDEVVALATPANLDSALIQGLLTRVRDRSTALAKLADEPLLLRLGVLGRDHDGTVRPTLAGLLSLGEYPQEFFPQLFVSFLVLPGTRMGELSPDGRRFLDNRSLEGPIPAIVNEAVSFAIRNMRVGAIIRGAGREDRYDYPLEVIRELVVNALMHRDYSPEARGTQVQIELYLDRLVIKSTGGLYGQITVADLGTEDKASTSRNQRLAKILTDVPLSGHGTQTVCENRGTGLIQVMAELRRVGMSPPDFGVGPAHVTITVPQHALLSPEIVDWVGSLDHGGLTDAQHLALAMMRSAGQVTNVMLQAWGVDRLSAGQALKGLVECGLALRAGSRRYATYRLPEDIELRSGSATVSGREHASPKMPGVEADLHALLQAIRAGQTTTSEIRAHLGLSQATTARRIKSLIERGLIEATRPGRSSRQSYRLTNSEEH